jgi:hypothetical protein
MYMYVNVFRFRTTDINFAFEGNSEDQQFKIKNFI